MNEEEYETVFKDNGLANNHAYSLIKTQQAPVNGREEKFVNLRNPWGHGEWKGDWSKNDTKWTNELKKQLAHKY